MLARYAVLPSPSLASGPQLLLLCKLRRPTNHAESTLPQVFFPRNLKPFEISTYEKQGEGSLLRLTICYKKVLLPGKHSATARSADPYPPAPPYRGFLSLRDRKSTRLNSSHQIISYA